MEWGQARGCPPCSAASCSVCSAAGWGEEARVNTAELGLHSQLIYPGGKNLSEQLSNKTTTDAKGPGDTWLELLKTFVCV